MEPRVPAQPATTRALRAAGEAPSVTETEVQRPRRRHPIRWTAFILFTLLVAAIAVEVQTSWGQAWFFTRLTREIAFEVEPGPSSQVRFPTDGPYDRRLGYVRLPRYIERLTAGDYAVTAQSRMSPRLLWELEQGFFPSYREKAQGGLRIVDRAGAPLFDYPYPRRIYADFESVPSLVANSLLFIENRELLDVSQPYRNPAVEWERLGRAVVDRVRHWLHPEVSGGSGGSTLATQMEKFRHSPDGRTRSPRDKFEQMVSASLRAYLYGPDTRAERPRILVDYLNSMPLGAVPGFGEVTGLGDGLRAWYGTDFDRMNRLLRELKPGDVPSAETAAAYRRVLSLMLAQRRPSSYLGNNRDRLEGLTDSYLRVMARDGVISPELRDEALAVRTQLVERADVIEPELFAARKSVNMVRIPLLSRIGANSLYELDRVDVDVTSTLDRTAQRAVADTLQRLADRKFAEQAGVVGFRLLGQADLSKVVYSFTLYERGSDYHRLRVQTDSLNQPFSVNDGLKLDLGSTAKLRTYVHYLEVIAQLHQRYAPLSPAELKKVNVPSQDRLARFVVDYLTTASDRTLTATLQAAKARTYSASPSEAFFTGGGRHTFVNFDSSDNGKVLSVQDALRQSVNLVFIRLMRDLVRHHIYQRPSVNELLENPDAPQRMEYLARFADMEGSQYLRRFYTQYREEGSSAPVAHVMERVQPIPTRLAAVYRYVNPDAPPEAFAAALRGRLGDSRLSDDDLERLFERYGPERYSLADRGYIAQVHPLELWLAAYLARHPDAGLSEVLDASADERQAVYRWLFRTGRKHAQDRRILSLLEMEAFADIHQAWQRVGYPFDHLVPSYATSIGSSGDRPAALAELVGILLDNGVRRPLVRVERLHFGRDTPYETVVERTPGRSEQVLPPEVAAAVRESMLMVVESGTAIRVRNALVSAGGTPLRIGGKTGTGDHRQEMYGRGGRLIESKVMNRAATFVFFIGDRYFGTVTAYVPGPDAAAYKFTSALPVQVLKVLGKDLVAMMEHTPASEPPPPSRPGGVRAPLPEPLLMVGAAPQAAVGALPAEDKGINGGAQRYRRTHR